MTKTVRPVIPEKLIKPLQRYATAHNVSIAAAVALLITAALKQQRFLK